MILAAAAAVADNLPLSQMCILASASSVFSYLLHHLSILWKLNSIYLCYLYLSSIFIFVYLQFIYVALCFLLFAILVNSSRAWFFRWSFQMLTAWRLFGLQDPAKKDAQWYMCVEVSLWVFFCIIYNAETFKGLLFVRENKKVYNAIWVRKGW